nr:transglycosylase SLT domain-containing protein [Thermoflexibacter sp.]
HFIFLFFLQTNLLPEGTETVKSEGLPETQQFQKIIIPELPDTLSFAGEKVPLEDVDIRERLERELISNCYKHSSMLIILKREGKWKSRIQSILKEEGVPEDFFYLAVAESELDEYALSYAKALGFWQFLKETGKEFNLDAKTLLRRLMRLANTSKPPTKNMVKIGRLRRLLIIEA